MPQHLKVIYRYHLNKSDWSMAELAVMFKDHMEPFKSVGQLLSKYLVIQ